MYLINDTLHSNLVLFKSISMTFKTAAIRTLHSNLVLFKLHYVIIHSVRKLTFTFQSGSIQILSCDPLGLLLSTLHSNLVLFKWIQDRQKKIANIALHSNLVLFKWCIRCKFFISLYHFTFQSGSIQISLTDRNSLEFAVFTFQSGSIQIVILIK